MLSLKEQFWLAALRTSGCQFRHLSGEHGRDFGTRPTHRDPGQIRTQPKQNRQRSGSVTAYVSESMIRTGHVRAHKPQRIQVSASSNSGANGVGLYSLYGTAPGTLRGGMEPGKAIRLGPQSTAETLHDREIGSVGAPTAHIGIEAVLRPRTPAAPSVTHPAASPSVLSSRTASS